MQLIFKYGTSFFLVLLCIVFSWLTLTPQDAFDASAAERIANQISQTTETSPSETTVLIAVRDNEAERSYAALLEKKLKAQGIEQITTATTAREGRQLLNQLQAENRALQTVAATQATGSWLLFADLATDYPLHQHAKILVTSSRLWPNFLKYKNVSNVLNQISVIAIIAIGMTFVIIAGGIDLSVGSLIAFCSVITALLIRDYGGGDEASTLWLLIACGVGIGACGVIGAFSGGMVVGLDIPPFIVTLAMMLVASGLAFICSNGYAIPEVPEAFTWLGRGAAIKIGMFGGSAIEIPNAVCLTLVLYVIAHIVMSRTVLGRYVYAVGDNRQAAWLSGVPVKRVLMFTYILSGLLAGVGGVVLSSTFRSGEPTFGIMYELYVIAAVVVGGTSLTGGRGTVVGTLIGALLIGVINNGMNLLHVTAYWQKVILGLVILGAVLLDRLARSVPKTSSRMRQQESPKIETNGPNKSAGDNATKNA